MVLHVGVIEGGTAFNIIAEKARFLWDIRTITNDDPNRYIQRLQQFADEVLLPEMRAIAPESSIITKVNHALPNFNYQPNSNAENLVRRLSGDNSVRFASYMAETGLFQKAGFPSIIYGPGDIAQAHQPNEWVHLDQLRELFRFSLPIRARYESSESIMPRNQTHHSPMQQSQKLQQTDYQMLAPDTHEAHINESATRRHITRQKDSIGKIDKACELIRDFALQCPEQPGCYRMFDSHENLLYVGKAKNLRKRVISYSNRMRQTPRILRMISETASLTFTITPTEMEALLLESNLIKQQQPRYNVLLKDDKSMPRLLIRRDHDFPSNAKT